MGFRFYLGIFLAIFVGIFVANGFVSAGKHTLGFVKSKSYAFYESASDLGIMNSAGLVLADSELSDESSDKKGLGLYHFYPEHKPFPELSAKSYLVADLDSGQLLKKKNGDVKYPIASLSKLVTAIVSVETLKQDDVALVTYEAVNTYGKQGGLTLGQKIKVSDLLYPLLLESSNDAAEVLARHDDRKIFLANMNGKAKSIGLVNTFFADPSGLSSQNTSTVEDLFTLIQYIYKNKPEILNITKHKDYKSGKNVWFNISDFRSDKNYLGGKNGYNDEAFYTLIATFELPLAEKQNRKIAIVLLKSPKETKDDVEKIIYWLLENVYYE